MKITNQITNQKVDYDEKLNKCFLTTKYDNGAVSSEPITAQEAAQWKAEHEF